MGFIFTLFGTKPFFDQPNGIAWIGLIILVIGSFWLAAAFRKTLFQINRRKIWLFFVLFVLQPILSLCIGFRIGGIFSNFPIMLLTAIPWMIAAGIIGPIPSLLLAIWSGILNGLWVTHDPYVILITAFASLLFGWAVRQNLSGAIFKILRHPASAWIIMIVCTSPIFFISNWFGGDTIALSGSSLAAVNAPIQILLFLIGTIPAAILSEILFLTIGENWQRPKNLVIPKTVQSTRSKYLVFGSVVTGIILILSATLIWNVASTATLASIKNQMQSSAAVVSNDVPFFLQIGQSILAEDNPGNLLISPAENRRSGLQHMLSSTPYFQQVYLLDSQLQILDGYPESSTDGLTSEDIARLHNVENGQGSQTYVVQSQAKGGSLLSFIVPIKSSNNDLKGVVLGRTDLSVNPFSQGILAELKTMDTFGGNSILIDEYGRTILSNSGQISKEALETTGTTGFHANAQTNSMQYVSGVQGGTWKIVSSISNSQVSYLTFKNAWPFLLLVTLLLIAGFLGVYFYLAGILKDISHVQEIADLPLVDVQTQRKTVRTINEIGGLQNTILDIRTDAQTQIEEKEQLLQLSNSIQSFDSLDGTIQPILDLIRRKGADSVRVIVNDMGSQPGSQSNAIILKNGATAELFSYLDSQILDLLQKQNQLILPFAARSKQLNLMPGFLHPGALIAVSFIRNEQKFGAVWAAYDQPHNFSKTDIQFFEQMSGEIQKHLALNLQFKAVEKALNKAMETINKLPQPVFTIDSSHNLGFINEAGFRVPGIVNEQQANEEIERKLTFKPLDEFLQQVDGPNISTKEIEFPNKHSYQVSVVPLEKEGKGHRLIVLQDSTAEKDRLQKQNDFIGTVSHDMRSPLTLIKGYINMLEMVGALNDQQKDFVQKIVINVDSMTKLVNNILDIERLESGVGLKKELTSPEEILDEAIADLRPAAVQKNISVDCAKETTEKFIVDRFLLKQALYNLVENGIKYSAVGGKVDIRLTKKDNNIEFIIQDHGVGIAPIDLPKIFDKKYRNNLRNQDQNRGAGLGLSIVQSIAERHGGKAWVESQLGKGSTFHLEIPVVESV